MCGHKTCDVIRERKYPEGEQKGTMHSACGNVLHVALYGGSLRWNSVAEVVCGYLEYFTDSGAERKDFMQHLFEIVPKTIQMEPKGC